MTETTTSDSPQLRQHADEVARAFATTVRELRKARGWSQDELARRLSANGFAMHQTTVAKLEGGTRPTSVDEVAALAVLLGVPIGRLYDRSADTVAEPLPDLLPIPNLRLRLLPLPGGSGYALIVDRLRLRADRKVASAIGEQWQRFADLIGARATLCCDDEIDFDTAAAYLTEDGLTKDQLLGKVPVVAINGVLS